MKLYALITGLLLLAGLWPPILVPVAAILHGAMLTAGLLWTAWPLLLLAAAGAVAYRAIRPTTRPRTVRAGRNTYSWKRTA